MLVGAGFAHNFGLAAAPDQMVDGALQVGGPSRNGQIAILEYLPTNLRLPGTDRVDVAVYHWLSTQWRAWISWMGRNLMVDLFFTGVIGNP